MMNSVVCYSDIGQGGLDFVLLDYTKRLRDKPDTMSADEKKCSLSHRTCLSFAGVIQRCLFTNVLGMLSQIVPERRIAIHRACRILYIKFKVFVDGKLSGTTALSHFFSTKPSFDLEYYMTLVGDIIK